MSRQELQDFVDEVMMKVTEMASQKDLENEEYLVFLSKTNERISDSLTYCLLKALPQ